MGENQPSLGPRGLGVPAGCVTPCVQQEYNKWQTISKPHQPPASERPATRGHAGVGWNWRKERGPIRTGRGIISRSIGGLWMG